eukprot:tig00000331_g24144.t1
MHPPPAQYQIYVRSGEMLEAEQAPERPPEVDEGAVAARVCRRHGLAGFDAPLAALADDLRRLGSREGAGAPAAGAGFDALPDELVAAVLARLSAEDLAAASAARQEGAQRRAILDAFSAEAVGLTLPTDPGSPPLDLTRGARQVAALRATVDAERERQNRILAERLALRAAEREARGPSPQGRGGAGPGGG